MATDLSPAGSGQHGWPVPEVDGTSVPLRHQSPPVVEAPLPLGFRSRSTIPQARNSIASTRMRRGERPPSRKANTANAMPPTIRATGRCRAGNRRHAMIPNAPTTTTARIGSSSRMTDSPVMRSTETTRILADGVANGPPTVAAIDEVRTSNVNQGIPT